MRTCTGTALLVLLLASCEFDPSVRATETGAQSDASTGVVVDNLALSFDGTDDYLRVNRSVADDFTLEAWIRTMASRDGSRFFHGLGVIYADVSGGASDFGTSILNDHFCFGTGYEDRTLESVSVVTTGEWVHVAAVRTMSDGVLRVFVNGQEEASMDSNNRDSVDASATIDIGGNVIDSHYFEGDIDEVRIWNRARSGSEIMANMNSRMSGTEANLVGYWTFDSDSGEARDSSPSQNHGSFGGGNAGQEPSHIPSDAPLN